MNRCTGCGRETVAETHHPDRGGLLTVWQCTSCGFENGRLWTSGTVVAYENAETNIAVILRCIADAVEDERAGAVVDVLATIAVVYGPVIADAVATMLETTFRVEQAQNPSPSS